MKLIWRKTIQVVLSIQVQFLNYFSEQGNKRKIILRNKAIYFRGTGADFSGEQGNRYPLGGPQYDQSRAEYHNTYHCYDLATQND